MRDIAEKLRRLERALAGERGPFNLFALFLREDAPDVWDLVVAAKWIDEDRSSALAEVSQRVRDSLGDDEITKISRVVVVDRNDPSLKAIASTLSIEHGISEVANSTFFGLSIRHAFIITASMNPSPTEVVPRTAAAGSRR